MKAMILAAGEGKRFRPHTLTHAKPTIPFLNVPFGYYSLALLRDYELQTGESVEGLVANVHHLPDQVRELYQKAPFFGDRFSFSDESKELLGSAGGVLHAQKVLPKNESFVLLNADEINLPATNEGLHRLWQAHHEKNHLATLWVMDHPGVGSRFGGVWCDDKDRVVGFGKTAVAETKGWHFVGALVLSPKIWDYLKPDQTNLLYETLISGIEAGEHVGIQVFDGRWFEVGNLGDYLSASGSCLRLYSQYPQLSEWGFLRQRVWDDFSPGTTVTYKDDGGISVLYGRQTRVSPRLRVQGFAVIGDYSKLDWDCSLSEVVIGPDTHVVSGRHYWREFIWKESESASSPEPDSGETSSKK